MTAKLLLEITSAIFILLGFELINRFSLKGFYVMAAGQFLALVACASANLWGLTFMHAVNLLMQVRGWIKWKTKQLPAN